MISLSRTYACGGQPEATEGLAVPAALGWKGNPSVSAYGGATSPYTGEALVRRRLERCGAKAFPSEGKVARRAG